MRAIVLFFLISGMLTACSGDDNNGKSGGVSQDKPKIVTSIKPIQMIVLAVAGSAADVEQLIPDYASPHDYSFKPSDIRKVENADIVFRIDEHMETQLEGIFDNSKTNKTSIVSLAEVENIELLTAGNNQHKHGDEHDSSHDNKPNDHSNHDNVDFHIWTSPKNAVLMANKISKSLSDLDSKNAKQYQQNLEIFYERVKAETENLAVKLSPHKDKPYIVFHNSWQYFAEEFGLKKPIVIDIHEGVSKGAKTISSIRDRIVEENIDCVFYDSSISAGRLSVIAKTSNTVEIDVLAKSIALDQTTYIQWLTRMGNQIESCFSK